MLAMTSSRGSLKNARILIVEDEYFIADDLARALREAGATTVGPVGTVKQADDLLLSKERIDAAILDLNLRGEMAYALAERLAAAKLPVLIVSGYSGDSLPDSLRGVPQLEKPISPARVIDQLCAQLKRAR
ncbi:MAG TPA: response regulator [Sphingomicrobium sp.]